MFTFIGFAIVYSIYGMDGIRMDIGNPSEQGIVALKILQITQAIGLFVLPPLLLRYVERKSTFYFDFHTPIYASLWLYAFAMMLVAIPVWDFLGRWNASLSLPESLASVEEWMRAKEDELGALTKAFLGTDTIGGLISNFFMVGILAALGEELFFRGVLQNVFIRWIKNPHVAIWITAIIFSAIHLQFYGFVPRLFLGALLGYLYWWSNCIWLPILAHLVNNGYAIIAAFFLVRQGKPLDGLDYDEQTPYYIYLFSALALIYFIYRYYQYAKLERQLQDEIADGEKLD